MIAPRHIQRDLRLIHPDYFAVFHPVKERWQIRAWNTRHERRITGLEFEAKSDLINEVAQYNYGGEDVGYLPLDQRAIEAIRVGRWNVRNLKRFLPKVDEENAGVVTAMDSHIEDIGRQIAKQILKHYTSPMVGYTGATQ